ncbi:MAG: CoA transferase [Hyphomicrobiales bacterium]|nr:CoA transferase [Hyphomicrobiales bacterium]
MTAAPSSRDIVAELWRRAGGDVSALDDLKLSGAEPALPSSFRVGAAAQASIAAAALAAAELRYRAGAARQAVSVDMRHAAIEFRSEHYLTIGGKAPATMFDPLFAAYATGDDRFVRLHMNFPHHRENVLKFLDCAPTRASIEAALRQWEAVAFEAEAYQRGCVVAAMRSPEEWAAHPQAAAVASMPPVLIEKIGDAPPRPLPRGARPLSGLRVLDLTRIIAGPVAGRALAAHGADVMRISAPGLPFIDWLVKDTGRGKLSAYADLASPEGKETLARLVEGADIVLQAFRPGALDARGFGIADMAATRPGVVYGSLSAYGAAGPWAGRRGFDSLVQTATGFNHMEAQAAGTEGPKELPCQALDHASGYLLAFGTLMARIRQASEGGSWRVRVSLAATGRWLWNLGRIENGFSARIPSRADVEDLLEESPSPFGPMRAVRHAAQLSDTPAAWTRPSVPLGTHPAVWPSIPKVVRA